MRGTSGSSLTQLSTSSMEEGDSPEESAETAPHETATRVHNTLNPEQAEAALSTLYPHY